jgi:hypothetical protein
VALPSVVTLGSLAFVLAAGAGYVVISTASADTAAPTRQHVIEPPSASPSKPIPSPHGASSQHRRPTARNVPSVLVVLFNNTGVTGVAEKKAAILEGAGWNVAATDNWYGKIPANTVYYPPQLRPDAVKLAKVLHIRRLHAAVAPMQFDELTVIISNG